MIDTSSLQPLDPSSSTVMRKRNICLSAHSGCRFVVVVLDVCCAHDNRRFCRSWRICVRPLKKDPNGLHNKQICLTTLNAIQGDSKTDPDIAPARRAAKNKQLFPTKNCGSAANASTS